MPAAIRIFTYTLLIIPIPPPEQRGIDDYCCARHIADVVVSVECWSIVADRCASPAAGACFARLLLRDRNVPSAQRAVLPSAPLHWLILFLLVGRLLLLRCSLSVKRVFYCFVALFHAPAWCTPLIRCVPHTVALLPSTDDALFSPSPPAVALRVLCLRCGDVVPFVVYQPRAAPATP